MRSQSCRNAVEREPGLTDDLADRGGRFMAGFDYTVMIENWAKFDDPVQL